MHKALPLAAVTAWLVSGDMANLARPDSDFRVTDVKARLYYQGDGTFSSFDAVADGPEAPASALWNTVIGEGSAAKPSSATLVLVRVSGPRGSARNATLHVVANGPSTRLADRLISLKPFSDLPAAWIPILLYDTGCERIEVTANIQGAQSAITKVIPFKCGE